MLPEEGGTRGKGREEFMEKPHGPMEGFVYFFQRKKKKKKTLVPISNNK